MLETFELIKRFHDAHGIPTPSKPVVTAPLPQAADRLMEWAEELRLISVELLEHCQEYSESSYEHTVFMRCHLILEEFSELAHALAKGDLIAVLDGLIDLRYVLDGSVLSLGFVKIFAAAFLEVHGSNMSKLEDGKPVPSENGRVKKGKNYQPPQLADLLMNFFANPGNGGGPDTSLSQRRVMRDWDNNLWAPADALRTLLREIEAGRCNPSHLVVSYQEPDAENLTRTFYYLAQTDCFRAMGILTMVQSLLAQQCE